MTWQDFYENYDNWSDSTLLSRISSLNGNCPSEEVTDCVNYISDNAAEKLVRKALSLGTVFTPNDIYEMNGQISEKLGKEILDRYMTTKKPISFTDIQNLDSLVPEECFDRIILYDLKVGYSFTAKQISELDGYGSEEVLTEALKKCKTKISKSDMENLEGIVDDDYLRKLDRKLGTHAFDDDWDEDDDSYDYADTSGKKPGLLSHLGAFFVADQIDKKLSQSSSRGTGSRRYRIGDRVYVRRYGKREPGTIADLDRIGYSVDLDNGLYLQGVRESDIERKGLFN